jgi:outer membrane autotransporter protein
MISAVTLVSRGCRRALASLCAMWIFISAPVLGQDTGTGPLTPNQQNVLTAIKGLCPQMKAKNNAGELSEVQQQLFFRCRTILNEDSGPGSLDGALSAIAPEQFTAVPRANVNFGIAQRASIVSRLLTLREGSGTLSGGGSGDADGPAIQEGKLGVYLHFKDGWGGKGATAFETAYDIKSRSGIAGIDYQITPNFVVGLAGGFGWNKADFDAGGSLKTEGGLGSLYASWSTDRQSLDLIGTFGSFTNDSQRVINYAVSAVTPVPESDSIASYADGSTRSYMSSVGLSYEYDFGSGPWLVGPVAAVDYIHVNVHSFAESGGSSPELDLSYGPQGGLSLQVQAGFTGSYVFSTPVGVFRPYVRAVYVRETKKDQEGFYSRYVNDAGVTNPTTGTPFQFLIQGDKPDLDYFRVSEGVSAQLAHQFSAFLDAESLLGYESIHYTEITLGVRYTF